jgi:hypothetical protein
MGSGIRKYLSGEYISRIEKKIDARAILLCWAFNIVVAFIVFMASWLSMVNAFATVQYTLGAWSVTLTLSVIYWLYWIQKRLKSEGVKLVASTLIIIMLAAGLLVVLRTIELITMLRIV